jgi:hypothetical protein
MDSVQCRIIRFMKCGLSRQFEDTPKLGCDGSEWDVEPDWETGAGLVYGINCISESLPLPTQTLRKRFESTPLFRDVIDALEGIQSGLGLRERKRARHRAARYMIEVLAPVQWHDESVSRKRKPPT